jgi:hypothetical protein
VCQWFWRAGAKATYPAVLESHQPDNWKRQAGFRLLFLPLAFSVRMTDKTIRWGVDLPRLRGVRKARTRADCADCNSLLTQKDKCSIIALVRYDRAPLTETGGIFIPALDIYALRV